MKLIMHSADFADHRVLIRQVRRVRALLSADVADDRRWKKCRCKFTNFSSPTSALICDICGQQPPARISPIPKPAQVALSEPYVMSVLVQNGSTNLLPQLGVVKAAIPLSRRPQDPEPIDMNHVRHHA